jgi:hypothetical protein
MMPLRLRLNGSIRPCQLDSQLLLLPLLLLLMMMWPAAAEPQGGALMPAQV